MAQAGGGGLTRTQPAPGEVDGFGGEGLGHGGGGAGVAEHDGLDVYWVVLIGGRFLAECCVNAGIASGSVCTTRCGRLSVGSNDGRPPK
jgi:hypothetical protein